MSPPLGQKRLGQSISQTEMAILFRNVIHVLVTTIWDATACSNRRPSLAEGESGMRDAKAGCGTECRVRISDVPLRRRPCMNTLEAFRFRAPMLY
jgi:hypothetical protein